MELIQGRRTGVCPTLAAMLIVTVLVAGFDPALSARHDLMLDYLTWEPEHPISGGLLSLHGRIKNVGDTQSSDTYTVSLYVDDWWVNGWLVRLAGFELITSPKIAQGRTQVWHFTISDYALFKKGNHQVKAVVSEPNDSNLENNELLKTLSISPGEYGNDFNIVNYGMCSKIDEDGLPLGITENFSLDHELATFYFYTDIKHAEWPEEMGPYANLTFRVYSPNGTLHAERSGGYSILPVKDPSGKEITGVAFQLIINRESQTQSTEGPLPDLGYQPLGKYPGTWRAEAISKGRLVLSERFIIEDTSSRILSTTSTGPEPASESTLATSSEGMESQTLRGYATAVGAIAIAAVVGYVALINPRLARRSRPHTAKSAGG